MATISTEIRKKYKIVRMYAVRDYLPQNGQKREYDAKLVQREFAMRRKFFIVNYTKLEMLSPLMSHKRIYSRGDELMK